MTVGELIEALEPYEKHLLVYIPSIEGTCETVYEVAPLRHFGLPAGIAIPDDVVLTPAGHDDMVEKRTNP